MNDPAALLVARLLAHRAIPRDDPQARRALADDVFRADLDARLSAVGLMLLENPYAEHIAVGLKREAEEPVFGGMAQWLNNNLNLSRDGVALLVVLWAWLILPKRERQITRQSLDDGAQKDLFGGDKPLPRGEDVQAGIPEITLIAEFGDRLGGKTRINGHLSALARAGFIERRNKQIFEGPLLDLVMDYQVLAPRIIEGALAEILAQRPEAAVPANEGTSAMNVSLSPSPSDGTSSRSTRRANDARLVAGYPRGGGEQKTGEEAA